MTTKSEILIELEENINQMGILISEQKFKVADAQHFLKRYFNIYRKMEQLIISRDNWKKKYQDFKKKNKDCVRTFV